MGALDQSGGAGFIDEIAIQTARRGMEAVIVIVLPAAELSQ